MKRIQVKIEGIHAMLMHKYPMAPIDGLDKKPPIEQAEIALYQHPDGTIYVPSINVQRCLTKAGIYSKGKGRSTLTKTVAATVFITPDALTLKPQTWELDSRRVVIPATKGGIIRHRPRFDKWGLEFEIEYDETLLTETQMRRIVDDGGSKAGIGDFRPDKNGPFGRFMVVEWKPRK